MITVHFYDTQTGLISHELRLSSRNPSKFIAVNTPAGHAPIFGVTDQLSQRVDIATGKLVAHQPERPDEDHDWDGVRNRWVKKAAARERDEQKLVALARIEELEKRQARRVRELLSKSDAQLEAIDNEVIALRAVLTGGKGTSEP